MSIGIMLSLFASVFVGVSPLSEVRALLLGLSQLEDSHERIKSPAQDCVRPVGLPSRELVKQLCAAELEPAVPLPSFIQLDQSTSEDYFVWAQVTNSTGTPPPALHGTMGVLDAPRRRTLLFGGCDPASPRAGCSQAMASHSIGTNAWGAIHAAGAPSPRAGGSATLLEEDIYLFAGDAAGVLTNDLVAFHPRNLAWSRPSVAGLKPPPRHEHAAVALHAHLWIVGGGSDGGFFDDVWVYSPAEARWAQPRFHAGRPPSARKGHALAAIGTKVYVWGGCAADCVDVAVHCLDTRTMTWEERIASTGAPPAARSGHVMAVVHERLVIVGGCDGKRGRCYGGVHVYDPVRDMWTKPTLLGPTPPGVQGAVAAVLGGELTLYGGCQVKGSLKPRLGGSDLCTSDAWSLSAHFTSLDGPAACPRNCSGNGLCHRGICACAPGYGGYGCEVRASCASNCSSHGVCVHGSCYCDYGFGGDDCSVPQQCDGACSHHGVCRHQMCFCDPGWSGPNCSVALSCPAGCSGRGLCVRGACRPAEAGSTRVLALPRLLMLTSGAFDFALSCDQANASASRSTRALDASCQSRAPPTAVATARAARASACVSPDGVATTARLRRRALIAARRTARVLMASASVTSATRRRTVMSARPARACAPPTASVSPASASALPALPPTTVRRSSARLHAPTGAPQRATGSARMEFASATLDSRASTARLLSHARTIVTSTASARMGCACASRDLAAMTAGPRRHARMRALATASAAATCATATPGGVGRIAPSQWRARAARASSSLHRPRRRSSQRATKTLTAAARTAALATASAPMVNARASRASAAQRVNSPSGAHPTASCAPTMARAPAVRAIVTRAIRANGARRSSYAQPTAHRTACAEPASATATQDTLATRATHRSSAPATVPGTAGASLARASACRA